MAIREMLRCWSKEGRSIPDRVDIRPRPISAEGITVLDEKLLRTTESTMTERRELYHSANGDKWYCNEPDGQVYVAHEPNSASGGNPSKIQVGTFLGSDNQ
jgi:hypothetical protein